MTKTYKDENKKNINREGASHLAQVEEDIAQLEADKSQLIRENYEFKRAIQYRDKKIHALESTFSWRITAPLRRLGYLFSIQGPQSVNPQPNSVRAMALDKMAEQMAKQQKVKPTILLFDFTLGGGSNLYSRGLITQLEKSGHKVILFEYRYEFKDYNVECYTGQEIANFSFYSNISGFISELLAKLNIDFMIINQLVSWPGIPNILNLIRESGTPYIFLVHDYFMICPNWTLFDYREMYCDIPDDPAVCAVCLKKIRKQHIPFEQHTDNKRIESWRANAGAFLKSADKVICFSETSLKIIKRAYPQLVNLLVNEHSIPDQNLFKWQQRGGPVYEILTIATIGSIGVNKGSKLIKQLLKDKRLSGLPFRLVIIGEIYPPPATDDRLVVHGSYSRQNLAAIMEHYKVSAVLISSICSETFCYTVSEALLLGYPVIACNLGAQAERVRRYDSGWIVDSPYINGLVSVIQRIVSSPNEIKEKSLNTKNYKPVTTDKHFSVILKHINYE